MIGFMVDNKIQAGQRADVREFISWAVKRAKKRLGAVPETALINLNDDEYGDALEGAGIKVMKAPWILPHSVYLLDESAS